MHLFSRSGDKDFLFKTFKCTELLNSTFFLFSTLIISCITVKTQLYYRKVIKYYISVDIKATCFGRNSTIIRPLQNI